MLMPFLSRNNTRTQRSHTVLSNKSSDYDVQMNEIDKQSLEDVQILFNDLIVNEVNKIIEEKTQCILKKQETLEEGIERKIDGLCIADDMDEAVKKYAKYVHDEDVDDDMDESVQKQLESVKSGLRNISQNLERLQILPDMHENGQFDVRQTKHLAVNHEWRFWIAYGILFASNIAIILLQLLS